MVQKFFSMFWGRMDVFAKRAKNGNYYPQCDNRWNNAKCPKQRNEKIYCEDCEHQCWTKLTLKTIEKYLLGYREDGADKSVTHVLNQIYEPIAEMNVKKVSVTKVTTALKKEGYLSNEPNPETGKTRKVPSVKGKELGIYMVEREYSGRMYQSVTYNRNAQEYVVNLIRKLLEE